MLIHIRRFIFTYLSVVCEEINHTYLALVHKSSFIKLWWNWETGDLFAVNWKLPFIYFSPPLNNYIVFHKYILKSKWYEVSTSKAQSIKWNVFYNWVNCLGKIRAFCKNDSCRQIITKRYLNLTYISFSKLLFGRKILISSTLRHVELCQSLYKVSVKTFYTKSSLQT